MADKHFKKISVIDGDIKVNIDLSRFGHQFALAQYELDNMIMTDMKSYMPMQTGAFINDTQGESEALAGTGIVVAGAGPMGRFLYHGKVMVDPVTQSPWARKGAKKILTEKDLTYGNPKATPKWFETAKKKHGKDWIEKVKQIGGGG